MTSLNVRPGLLPSSIVLPRSKSHANRALILAALSANPTTLIDVPRSSDVLYLVEALRQLGLFLEGTTHLKIEGNFPSCEPKGGATIVVGEGGTTGRFLACLLLLGREPYRLILGKRLRERPWDEFLRLGKILGAEVSLAGDVLSIRGPVKLPKVLCVDCAQTTQFASGLQLAFSGHDCEVRPVNLRSSESYWRLTEEIVAELATKRKFVIPIDWSSASYPLAFGALKQRIHFPGLRYDGTQADAKFYRILESLSAIEATPLGITVKPIEAERGLTLDVVDCLDLVPTLAFFLAHVPGKHRLDHVANLRVKESDRLTETQKLLSAFGKHSELVEDSLVIHGDHKHLDTLVTLELPDDHRMVMAGAMFLRLHAGGTVAPAEAVKKSYPGFFALVDF